MKCDICEKEVKPTKEYTLFKDKWTINAAVVGGYIELYGHKTCLQNVDNKVVIPNRIRLIRVS